LSPAVQTMFEFIDLDEGRLKPGKQAATINA
jgi:hypothetical protein